MFSLTSILSLLFSNISLSKVVFPVPLGPMIATLSLELISKLTSSKRTSSKDTL